MDVRLRTARREAALYGLLLVLAVSLALSRLVTGPWYHTWNPPEMSLLEGWPVSWEAVYYTDHFPTFAGNGQPHLGIAPVHYRTFLLLYLAVAFSSWTHSAYWSLVAVDVGFWFLAGVAAHRLALRLGAPAPGAALSAVLLVCSPVLVSHMWRGDLHPANFASLPLGLWAGVAILDSRLPPVRLALALTLLLVLASLSYQYQWVLAPLLLVLALTRARRVGPAVAAVLAAVGLYVLCTAAIEQILLRAVGPVTDWGNVAAQPGGMLLDRLAGVRSPAQVLELLPSRYYVEELVRSYHPLVLAVGVAGLALLGWRPLALGAVGLTISLFSLTYYSAPWAATSSYSLVYAGAGTACAALGSLAARGAALLPWRGVRTPAVTASLVWGCRLGLALLLVAATNRDLLGDPSFLLTWWRTFGGPYLF